MSDSSARRPSVTRDTVLAEALRIADAEGVQALSMRRLGRACGVEAMSLYHHVPDKAAVLDGISEAVFAEVELPDAPLDAPWEEELTGIAVALREALRRHPGALPLVTTRPSSHPPGLRLVDRVVAVLLRAGLRPTEALYAARALGAYVTGLAAAELGRSPGDPVDVGDEGAAAPPAEVPPEALPAYASACAGAAGQPCDWDAVFMLGLESMVAGLRQRVAGERSVGGEPPAG